MESHNRYVLLSYTLLRFDEACGLVNANDEISCNLGIEGTTVTCFFNVEHALNPCDDFVGGGVGGFVELHTQLVSILRSLHSGVSFSRL